MRNNLLIWLTGWNFGTYNNFHRWLARIATVQAIVHSLGYSALILRKGGWEYFWRLWALTFWWTGELATVFMSLLVVFSVFWVRRRQYEVFLVVHIVLSILILVTMLGHVWIFKGVYDALVWVPAVIWLLDRVLRGARIIAFNPVFWDTHASVTYNEQAHMIRLVVPLSSNFYQVKPGTFCYIMVLNKWDFWESHPFTVASVSGNNRSAAQPQEHAPLLRSEPLSLDDMGIEPKRRAEEMTFLIRPYDSFTSRLKEHAESSYPKPATLRVAIDGPYGRTAPLERFDKVLFVVGGSGIAVPLSYLETLIASSKRPKAIYIHWAVQQSALAIDVLHCELNEALKSNRVRVNVYVTRSQGRVSSDETTCRFVEWRTGRMSTEGVIQATLSTEETDSLAVVACGPARMADDCRRIVATKMVHSLPYIEYFEESFQW
ncbi:ferric-chelate reductase [Pochonia chlamydosporia 170]|uniref:Ferric-chelate reductase n=1 Tax=Pochonia chlamydosporia 170 TaxID=1380566 RepID=A0A179F7K5_METCM|nr:ferric-chelate reductase [Pochonia chlamydosporia 170]OAQ61397.2 ferric-chelate reductase [Pochonia chlamydosporia 170]